MPYKVLTPENIEKRRASIRKHYRNHKEWYLNRNKKKRKECQDYIKNYKDGKPCFRCSNIFPYYVLDYHHKDSKTKLYNVAEMSRDGILSKIIKEIDKCVLLCANCHRIETHEEKLRNIG